MSPPTLVAASLTPKSSTVTTVVILSSDDDEDCAVVDEKDKKKVPTTAPKTFKHPKSQSKSSDAVPNIANMEILSLIDKLSQKSETTEKPVDTGISLISSEESDSWNAGGNNGNCSMDDEQLREKRKAKKLKKKERRKREKLLSLKEQLNSKDKNIVELKKKLGYCSDNSLSSVESSSSKKKEIDKPQTLGDEPKKSIETSDSTKTIETSDSRKAKETDVNGDPTKHATPEEENKENPSVELPNGSSTEPLIMKEKPSVQLPNASSTEPLIIKEKPSVEVPTVSSKYIKAPLIIKEEVFDNETMIFTRRPKKEPIEVTNTDLPEVENTSFIEPFKSSTSESSGILRQLQDLLLKEVGVDMDDFLDIMKTDKYEIKKEIIAKVSSAAEQPPPAPRFQKQEPPPPPPRFPKTEITTPPPPPPPMQPRDPRIAQEINLNLNLNMAPTDRRNQHTLNLNISTSNGMQMNTHKIPHNMHPLMKNMVPPPPPPAIHHNIPPPPPPALHHNIPPFIQNRIPSPPLRDPRLRRANAQPPTLLNSPPIIHNSPIMNSPEYSPRDGISKPNFAMQSKQQACDKRAALTYGEYKKRKALEEQHKKNIQLKMLLSEIENKKAETHRQLNERQPILEDKIIEPPPPVVIENPKPIVGDTVLEKSTPISKPVVETTLSKPVIEYVKPSEEINDDRDDDEEEDEEESEIDEITKMNTLRNARLLEESRISQINIEKDLEKENSPPSEKDYNVDETEEEKNEREKATKPLNFREVIRLNTDIIQSFMPNDVLQTGYGRMTRRKSCSAARQDDIPPAGKIKNRRKSEYVAKKEPKKKTPKKKEPAKKEEIIKTKNEKPKEKDQAKKKEDDSSWQVEQKSPTATGSNPKINLIIRKRGKFSLSIRFHLCWVIRSF